MIANDEINKNKSSDNKGSDNKGSDNDDDDDIFEVIQIVDEDFSKIRF